jgi:metalloprotein, YbeY family
MIGFEAEGVQLPDLDYAMVREWISRVAVAHGFTVGRLSYLFCDDEAILEANRRHLGHDYYTDIITFDYTRGSRIGGDMIISLDTVASNAGSLGEDYGRELLRVIIHGVLHLCGIDDKGPGEREIMERNENEALALWHD